MRLPRTRKGKTPLDVTLVEQYGNKRVRITLGEDSNPRGKYNTDMDAAEVTDLIALLNYNMMILNGEIDP